MTPGGALAVAGFGPLTVIAIALAAVVFALLVHNLRRRASGGHGASPGAPSEYRRTAPQAELADPGGPGLPDWSHADAPLLDESALKELMHSIAARAGIRENVLPRIALPSGSEGEFVYRDRFDYVYVGLERGGLMFERASAVADQLMYFVFRDRAWMKAYIGLVGEQLSPDEHAERLVVGQQAILSSIDPRWERQLIAERELASGG